MVLRIDYILLILLTVIVGVLSWFAWLELSAMNTKLDELKALVSKPNPQIATLDTRLTNSIKADSVMIEQFVKILNSQASLHGKKLKGNTIIYNLGPQK